MTRRSGDTSTACLRTVPARPMRVESSRGPLLMMAFTRTCRGFCGGGKKKKGIKINPYAPKTQPLRP